MCADRPQRPTYTAPGTDSSRPIIVPRVYVDPSILALVGPAFRTLILLHDHYGFRPIRPNRAELARVALLPDTGRMATLRDHLALLERAGCLLLLDPVPGKSLSLQLALPTLTEIHQGGDGNPSGSSRGEGLGSRDSGLESQGKIKEKGRAAARPPVVQSGGQLQLVLLTVHQAIEAHRPRPSRTLEREIYKGATLFSRRLPHLEVAQFARAIEHLLVKAVDRKEPIESVYGYLRRALEGIYADGAERRADDEKAAHEAEDRAVGLDRRSAAGWGRGAPLDDVDDPG